MQFHLNGYQFGDPESVLDEERQTLAGAKGSPPAEVDVLVVGAGPAGLTVAAQLAAFGDIKTCVVEQRAERLLCGQADGVACRSVEMFHAFGFADRVLRESYWVNETAFWRPDPDRPGAIARSRRVQDVEDGLSEFPHVTLNQARVHDFYLDVMRKSPGRVEPFCARRLKGLVVDEAAARHLSTNPAAHPVTVTLERLDPGHEGETETLRARYVVGCDGARGAVRGLIGRTLVGDYANQGWGVMDVLAVTDFPDIRLKCIIKAPDGGSILLIPREGGHLSRIYVELESLKAGERVTKGDFTLDTLIASAQRIFHPYTFEVKDVAWWSIYEVGQRLTDKFDDVPSGEESARAPRVFIAGDACHTHSAKAGQGMNVSMQDGFNLGWKLAAVLRGLADPDLLHSYSGERQAIAKTLIDFDREWASLLHAAAKAKPGPDGREVTADDVQRYFVQHGRYTAGVATRYRPSRLTGAGAHQALASGFEIGTRFHSGPVTRLGDALPMELGHVARADGAFRLYAFADASDPADRAAPLDRLCDFLAKDMASPLIRHTPLGWDSDSVIDLRAILQQPHRSVALQTLHPLLLPFKGRFGLRDYEKIFCPARDPAKDIFDLRGIDRARGALVIVRPDQYVADILPLDAFDALAQFFAGVLRRVA